jgi:hypothetical protein
MELHGDRWNIQEPLNEERSEQSEKRVGDSNAPQRDLYIFVPVRSEDPR